MDDKEIIKTVDALERARIEAKREKDRLDHKAKIERIRAVKEVFHKWVMPGLGILLIVAALAAGIFGIVRCNINSTKSRQAALESCVSAIGSATCDRVAAYHDRLGEKRTRMIWCKSENSSMWSTQTEVEDHCVNDFNTWLKPYKDAYLLCLSKVGVETCDLVK